MKMSILWVLLTNDFKKFKPYDFEPLVSSDDENTTPGQESSSEPNGNDSNGEELNNEVVNRIGNTNWCKCGQCKEMDFERECWCCVEANEISD